MTMGTKSSATTSETSNVDTMEMPIFLPSNSIIKFEEKRKGRKTVTVVSVDATMDRHTSFVPRVTDSSGPFPIPASR